MADFPRSYHEARLALRVQAAAGGTTDATVFDELGVYRLLAGVDDLEGVEQFVHAVARRPARVRRRQRGIRTGRDAWASTSTAAGATTPPPRRSSVHRSTLKYRLQRIREISGHDLGSPEVQFNLQLAVRALADRSPRYAANRRNGIPAHRSARCVTECVVDRHGFGDTEPVAPPP